MPASISVGICAEPVHHRSVCPDLSFKAHEPAAREEASRAHNCTAHSHAPSHSRFRVVICGRLADPEQSVLAGSRRPSAHRRRHPQDMVRRCLLLAARCADPFARPPQARPPKRYVSSVVRRSPTQCPHPPCPCLASPPHPFPIVLSTLMSYIGTRRAARHARPSKMS